MEFRLIYVRRPTARAGREVLARVPRGSMEGRTELPSDPDPKPFFCLLEDDSLVTKVSVESEQLLRPARPDEVVAIIAVHVKKTVLSYDNMSL